MANLRKDILDNDGGNIESTESLVIEQKLNKLFYIQPNYSDEIKMLQTQAKLKSSDRYGLHASAILASDNQFCYREQVLSLFYQQIQGDNVPIRLKRIFEEGNFIGEKWQRLFIRGNIGDYHDMDISRFNDKYDLSYTPDAIIKVGKYKYVVEIKSQNTFTFKKQKGHPGGELQCLFYQFLEGIHRGFTLVEDKNDQNFKVLMVKYEPTKLEKYIERLEIIQIKKQNFIKKKKVPKRICIGPTCKRALECSMRDACFNIGIGRVKLDL